MIVLVIFAANLVINILSIALAARINNVAVFTEIVGMVGFAVVVFIAWAIHPNHGLGFLLNTGSANTGGLLLVALPAAALMGIFTIVGFELAADLGEEAVGARITVPKAVIWSVASSAILGMIALIGFTIALPNDYSKIASSATPLVDIVNQWLGSGLSTAFLVLVIFSILALDVVGLAATGRLVFAMARDNILPGSGFLRVVNPQTRTPIRALVTASLLGCCSRFSATTSRSAGRARTPSSPSSGPPPPFPSSSTSSPCSPTCCGGTGWQPCRRPSTSGAGPSRSCSPRWPGR